MLGRTLFHGRLLPFSIRHSPWGRRSIWKLIELVEEMRGESRIIERRRTQRESVTEIVLPDGFGLAYFSFIGVRTLREFIQVRFTLEEINTSIVEDSALSLSWYRSIVFQ